MSTQLNTECPVLRCPQEGDGAAVQEAVVHSIDGRLSKFEMGYWCITSLARNGDTTEASAALVHHAFESLGAVPVEAFPDAENICSRRVCERVGMALEGMLVNVRTTPNALTETLASMQPRAARRKRNSANAVCRKGYVASLCSGWLGTRGAA
jgi:RimJ/RimL family protein N-acetyltransferase